MINHAFNFFESILFHVDEANFRSQKAMEKIGGIKRGLLKRPRPDGSQRVLMVYEITKSTISI
jgi:RimJ/RimL family protein N-acetyltransferase